ncbi:uncharacterized protein LOC108739556 isoform X2 [Agrilus planipennis]|uniref:Uncharacterized protein LOC108739556 isoform X2 n=1 Tax=Agrilus planipennis TaxID=224129 RepID=A0A1W4X9K1_AGRPL|nr:uncharacterized protein LOC108739556 isoform X2 [Agrilus planipennis]
MCENGLRKLLNLHDNDVLTITAFNSISDFDICVRTDLNRVAKEADSSEQCNTWIKQFSAVTKTKWIIRNSGPHLKTMVYRKLFVCHRSNFNKICNNDRGRSHIQVKSKGCTASIDIKIKKINRYTIRNDINLQNGLSAVINIKFNHNHLLHIAEVYNYLNMTEDKRKSFTACFNDELIPNTAEMKLTSLYDKPENVAIHPANSQENLHAWDVISLYDECRKQAPIKTPAQYQAEYRQRLKNKANEVSKKQALVVKQYPRILKCSQLHAFLSQKEDNVSQISKKHKSDYVQDEVQENIITIDDEMSMSSTQQPIMREDVHPLLLPTMKNEEENMYSQAEMKQKLRTADSPLWKACIDTEVEIDVKQELKNDIDIGLEMDVVEENEPVNDEQMITHQELFIATQLPPIIEQSSFEENTVDPLQTTEPIVRESPSFKSLISVRDIRTLTNSVPTLVQSMPPTVPLKLRKVPRSEALLAVLKTPSSLVRAPPSEIKQYAVKKPPLKIIKPSIDSVLVNSCLLKAKPLNQNFEGSEVSDSNEIGKQIPVKIDNQVNRENENTLPLITLPSTSDVEKQRQDVTYSNTEVIELDETDMQSEHQPNIMHKVGQGITVIKNSDKMSIVDSVRKSEPIYLKCKSSPLELICVLCALSTSPTYNIQPMAPFIKEIVDVNISDLTLPLRACAQCIKDMNVALRLRNRVRKAYKKLIQNTRSEDIDDPVPMQIPPEKVLRTYAKSSNLQKTDETKSVENISVVENSTPCFQRVLVPYQQNEKENHSNSTDKLISYENMQSEVIDIDLISDDENKGKQNERNTMKIPNLVIKSIVNKGSQIEQERENKVEIRESQLKNSHIKKINENQYEPPLQQIIDSEKEDSDDDLNTSKKPKICFCRANIPRDIFQLPDTQLRREFAKEKYITSRCLRCFQWFPCAKRLRKHVRRRCSLYAAGPERNFVDGIETRTCDLCQCVFRSHIDVLIHKDSIHNSNNCPDCLMRFKDSFQATKHTNIHKTDDATVCLYCARLVPNRSYKVHRITHGWDWWTWRRRRCNKCNGEVVKEEIYICTVCGMKFRTPTALQKHSWGHKKKDFICKICTKVFLTRSTLKRHLRTHSTDDQKINRNVQHEGIQSNTKPHKCGICKASFLRMASKKRHMNEKHTAKQINVMQEQTTRQLVETVKTFKKVIKCEICNMTFINNKVKSRHMTVRHSNNIIKEEQVDVEENVINAG